MTPEDRRTQTDKSIAQADAAVERARAAAEQAEQIAKDSPHTDKTLIDLAYRADHAAGDAHDRRALTRYYSHHAADPDAPTKIADEDAGHAQFNADRAEASAEIAEIAARDAKSRAARG